MTESPPRLNYHRTDSSTSAFLHNVETSGIAGAGLTYVLTPENQRSNTTLGDTVLHRDINIIQGFFLEFVLTFILTLAVYAAKDTGRKCEGYDVSLAYGFAVTVCHLVGVSLTYALSQ